MPGGEDHAVAILREAVAGIPSTGGHIHSRRIGSMSDELKFAAHAVMHLWLSADHRVRVGDRRPSSPDQAATRAPFR